MDGLQVAETTVRFLGSGVGGKDAAVGTTRHLLRVQPSRVMLRATGGRSIRRVREGRQENWHSRLKT